MERTVMDLAGAPWAPAANRALRALDGHATFESKKLTAPDGRSVRLVHYDGAGAPHFHLKPSTLYVFDGTVELRGRRAGAGSWVLEPFGAIHARTRFDDVVYGFGLSAGEGTGPAHVFLEDCPRLPGWMLEAAASVEDDALIVASAELAWQPCGPGLQRKVLHVAPDRPAFVSLIRAAAGARFPRRRYLGPVDIYVLAGRAVFADAVAERGWWVHEPADAVDGEVCFPDGAELLVNTYGTVLDLDADGAVTGAVDGYTLERSVSAAASAR